MATSVLYALPRYLECHKNIIEEVVFGQGLESAGVGWLEWHIITAENEVATLEIQGRLGEEYKR